MPHLPYSIELHDSEISRIEKQREDVYVIFSHAYIHKDGKGWSQEAIITVSSAQVVTNQSDYPVKISDGYLRTKLGPYHNLLNLPFSTEGKVELELKFQSGNTATVKGKGIDVTFSGERIFIEDFPNT